jgi:hypothetical protein
LIAARHCSQDLGGLARSRAQSARARLFLDARHPGAACTAGTAPLLAAGLKAPLRQKQAVGPGELADRPSWCDSHKEAASEHGNDSLHAADRSNRRQFEYILLVSRCGTVATTAVHAKTRAVGRRELLAAPLHVSIAVTRIMRVLGQLPEVNRAADAVKTIRIVTGNLFAQAEWAPGLDRVEILRALLRGIRDDLPILDRELSRGGNSDSEARAAARRT